MIEEIRITSLGVIAESTLELGVGLNVITGETGAGKTMLITALGLLMGQRADPGVVRAGARSARVEGVFIVDAGSAAVIEGAGGEVEEQAALLARQIAKEGRSRAFAGGVSVPAATLAEVTQTLVAVHGQADQHRLLKPETQLGVLDRFAGTAVAAPLAEYQAAYSQLRAIEAELREVITNARERAREADLLRHGLSEVDAVAPTIDEPEGLAAEESRLGNADSLLLAAQRAQAALSADDDSADALGALVAAKSALAAACDFDPEVKGLAERLAEVSYLVSDLASDLAAYSTSVQTDPTRLAAVSQRRAAITALLRKYGDNVAEVLAWAQEARTRLATLDNDDERVTSLREQRRELRFRLAELASGISTARGIAADRIGLEVTRELSALAMPHARLEVRITRTPDPRGLVVDGGEPVRFGSAGVDEVAFVLAANSGSDFRPLNRGASGGELSRVMLAVEVVLAGSSPVPTMVFDEVDAGVGGRAAVEVGRRLAMLAQSTQVLVVTHLAQVAAYADRHLVVRKSEDGVVSGSDVEVLDHAGRVRELSRMLAGQEESSTALAHAEELLDLAKRR